MMCYDARNNGGYMMPSVDKIMRYEDGEMDDEETVTFFQELIDSGVAWQLQGHYGRMATDLIKAGYCMAKE